MMSTTRGKWRNKRTLTENAWLSFKAVHGGEAATKTADAALDGAQVVAAQDTESFLLGLGHLGNGASAEVDLLEKALPLGGKFAEGIVEIHFIQGGIGGRRVAARGRSGARSVGAEGGGRRRRRRREIEGAMANGGTASVAGGKGV